jgi:hypothetical protein
MRETAWDGESGAAALAEPGRVIRMARALAQPMQCAVGERIMVYSAATGTPPCSARYHLEQEKTQ